MATDNKKFCIYGTCTNESVPGDTFCAAHGDPQVPTTTDSSSALSKIWTLLAWLNVFCSVGILFAVMGGKMNWIMLPSVIASMLVCFTFAKLTK